MPPDQEIEIKGYFGKYIEDHFKHIDDTVTNMKENMDRSVASMNKTAAGIKEDLNNAVKRGDDNYEKIKLEVDEIKADNKASRRWIVGTGIAVLFGIAAIFFSFAQIQASWMQQVIALALKAIK
jgi:hypothetical protein